MIDAIRRCAVCDEPIPESAELYQDVDGTFINNQSDAVGRLDELILVCVECAKRYVEPRNGDRP